MGIFKTRQPVIEGDDATLVMLSLGGDTEAFTEIVSRYQNLLCSLAYSSVGDIKHSEDLAQEAFVEAWKKLDSLREPHKLKSWLCGILRFKVNHHYRKAEQHPVNLDDAMQSGKLVEAHQEKLEDVAISEQQEALMWQALDDMEATYREPLILFYRQDRSIEQVARQLDLSEDTAKQRLSRGRKLLQKSLITLVEEVLEHSKPGAAFTAAVLTAVNSIAPPAKAAAMGAGAWKSGSVFSLATFITVLASLSGVISGYFGLRAGLAQSRTQRERRETIKLVTLFFSMAILWVIGELVLKGLATSYSDRAALFAILSQLLVAVFVLSYMVLTKRMFTKARAMRAEERLAHPQAFSRELDQPGAKQREYKSALTLFGTPLVHIRFGAPEEHDAPVKGWIAGGDYAYGLLFAWGGVAVAPLSVGIVSCGIVTIGAVGFGLISAGSVGIGVLAFGASAVGYKAYASLSSLGWESAFSNGFSIAKEAAIGPIAYAAEVNNEAAAQISNLATLGDSYLWILAAISVFVITPAAWYAKKVGQRMK